MGRRKFVEEDGFLLKIIKTSLSVEIFLLYTSFS